MRTLVVRVETAGGWLQFSGWHGDKATGHPTELAFYSSKPDGSGYTYRRPATPEEVEQAVAEVTRRLRG